MTKNHINLIFKHYIHMHFGFQHRLVLILEVNNTPGHPMTPLYKVFLQQFICLKLKMKFLVFKEAECSFLHAQQHASKVYSQPAQSCPYLLENPSKIITLNGISIVPMRVTNTVHLLNIQFPPCLLYSASCSLFKVQQSHKVMNISTEFPKQSTMQNFRFSQ
jgi:hypothetical protein